MIKLSRHQNHLSKTSRKSNPIIHISIRSTKISQPVKNNNSIRPDHSRRDNNKSIIDSSIKLSNTITNFNSIPKLHQHEILSSQLKAQEIRKNDGFCQKSEVKSNHSSKLSKVAPSRIEDTWANPSDYTIKHDQNKNRKKKTVRKQCVVIALVSLFILITIMVILLAVFLSRAKTRTKPSTSSSSLRWNATGLTIAGVTNQSGNASNLLYRPFGITLDSSNTLYIADTYNHRVQKYLPDASFGETVAGQKTGLYGANSSFLIFPIDLTVETNGDIYVSDMGNHRIQLWTSGSTTGVAVAGTGIAGNGNNQLNYSRGVVHDPISNALYVADSSNQRVMRYSSNAAFGTVVAGGNGPGINNTQLYSPGAIHFDAISNSLLIANYDANNIVRWTLGASNWELIAGNQNGTRGSTSTGLGRTMDVTLDPMGNSYVVDFDNQRIQFFPSGERNGRTIAGVTGLAGSNATLLNYPASVALDNQLNLYVSDTLNHRVQKFVRY